MYYITNCYLVFIGKLQYVLNNFWNWFDLNKLHLIVSEFKITTF